MKFRKKNLVCWIGKLHLWLGLAVGPIVVFMGITGCILAFEREIGDMTQAYRFTEEQNRPLLPPSELRKIADKTLPGKIPHSVSYEPGRSTQVVYYSEDPEYYYSVYINPYTGQVLKTKDMNRDFFRVVIMGHFYLWLPPKIGQPFIASATLVFVILLISGLILWWPKSKPGSKRRFTVKWNARWRKVNYDFHNVMGFYITWVLIFIAFTGLVWGFQWFAKSAYWITSGGEELVVYEESFSDTTLSGTDRVNQQAIDLLWMKIRKENPGFRGSMDVHVPVNNQSAIEIALNPDTDTYWKADYFYYDQHSLREIEISHLYGQFSNAGFADKIFRMNYDVHVGAIAGITGKVIAFFASLITASMPVTGFIIWWGRRKKKPSLQRGL